MRIAVIAASFALLGAAPNATAPAHMIISLEAHQGANPPVPTPQDVLVFHNNDRREVTALAPLSSTGLELWILIDDDADASIGNQFGDLRKFVLAQPANFEIGVGYMRNGSVTPAQAMTSDHNLAAKAFRLPLGEPGISASPYTTLTDLIHKWPETKRAREVLMISSGIDLLYGPGPENPYLQTAIDTAQRAGIVANSIYFNSAGHFSHSYWQITWGQNNLSQLAYATGGEFYWQGMTSPVSFSPYLDQFSRRLQEQYVVSFQAPCGSGLDAVKVRTELPHVSLVAPARTALGACSGH